MGRQRKGEERDELGRPREYRGIYYNHENVEWKVDKFDVMRKEFNVTVALMPDFHALASQDEYGLAWRVVRMLYGIYPSVPDLDSPHDYMRAFTRAEICVKLEFKPHEVDEQLGVLSHLWHRHMDRVKPEGEVSRGTRETTTGTVVPPNEMEVLTPLPEDARAKVEENLTLIQRFGFPKKIFELPGNDEWERATEIEWLATRLPPLEKIFAEPMARGIAEQALLNELYIKRCSLKLLMSEPGTKAAEGIQKSKANAEELYRKQWEQLETLCPYIKQITQQVQVHGLISEQLKAWRDWRANRKNDLVDGMFTAYGIQILFRASIQAPDPAYRPGWVFSMLQAKEGIRDPKFKNRVPPWITKLMDDALREVHAKAVESGKVKLTDLESEGANGEYPALAEPAEEGEEQIVLPEEQVALEEAS